MATATPMLYEGSVLENAPQAAYRVLQNVGDWLTDPSGGAAIVTEGYNRAIPAQPEPDYFSGGSPSKIAKPSGTGDFSNTTAVPAGNPYMPQYATNYEKERIPYNDAYKYYLSVGDYAGAENITDKFYNAVGMARPTSGPGSKAAVAAAFNVQLPAESTATAAPSEKSSTPKPVPVYEDRIYKYSDGVYRNEKVKVGERIPQAEQSSASQPTQSAVPDTASLEQRLKFIASMRSEIAKQFGFDPFESPHNRAVAYTEKFFMDRDMYMPGMYGEMDKMYARKLAEFQAQQQEAAKVLEYGMNMYDAQHGLKVLAKPQYGGLLQQGNKIVADIKPDQVPVVGTNAAVMNGKLYVLPQKQQPVVGEGIAVIPNHNGGYSIINTGINQLKYQPNAQTAGYAIGNADAKFRYHAKKLGATDSEIEDANSRLMTSNIPPNTPLWLAEKWGPIYEKLGRSKEFLNVIQQISSGGIAPQQQAQQQAQQRSATAIIAAPSTSTTTKK